MEEFVSVNLIKLMHLNKILPGLLSTLDSRSSEIAMILRPVLAIIESSGLPGLCNEILSQKKKNNCRFAGVGGSCL